MGVCLGCQLSEDLHEIATQTVSNCVQYPRDCPNVDVVQGLVIVQTPEQMLDCGVLAGNGRCCYYGN